ncbi:adenosine kinase [Topomyia yanbarensis]|uniref:adenosine kinase n=1 Tax=Topomyia yanbarensis TaxID=2498891 RepID=UPI00273C2877|nr:adenosine kinase [Topomyia yanbarensis]XP_058819041.1 adenosine kinase [Topomyia yanbarensis]
MQGNSMINDSTIISCDRCPRLVAFGNVLLDISVDLREGKILHDFDLKEDDQREIPADKLARLVNVAVETCGTPKYNPGGSALNTCRILRALGEKNVMFCGAVGADENGEILMQILKDSSLNTCIQTLPEHSTGTCICLISGDKRSLNANIGASLHFKKEFVTSRWCQSKIGSCNSAVHDDIDEDVRVFYVEGYFIPEKFNICKYIYEKYCKGTANLFVTNLNATYILQNFTKEMKYLVEQSDLVFGNLTEFVALAEIYQCDSVDELTKYLIRKYLKLNREKIIVSTDASRCVRFYHGNGSTFYAETHQVPVIPQKAVIDTTGAGDSFVAGFLYKYMNGDSPTLLDCIRYGSKIAGKVIRQVGCNLPSSLPPSPMSVLPPTESLV